MEQERTIKIQQIQKVIGDLSISTLNLYLKNWRFAPYIRFVKEDGTRWHYEYLYCKDFFNNFYTYLVNKRKTKAAKNLKDTFKQVNINLEYLED